MEINEAVLSAILDAYPYEIVFVDRTHTVRYMNKTAKKRYEGRVFIGNSLFNCHNESTKPKIEAFLERADAGEDEMFEVYNGKTGEREFFTPVRRPWARPLFSCSMILIPRSGKRSLYSAII